MKDPMFLTIVFIVISTLIGAVIRRVKKDNCLKDFSGYLVTLKKKTGEVVWGKFKVFNTGLELAFPKMYSGRQGRGLLDESKSFDKGSFLLYKSEYSAVIQVLIRYHDQLSESNKTKRLEVLKKAYHPGLFRRLKRKVCNVLKTVKDSVIEVVNLLISTAKTRGPAKSVITSQSKHVDQMRDTLMGAVGTSYEPMLEEYIGHKVILEVVEGDKVVEYCGVLEDYSKDFIVVMDVDYGAGPDNVRKADLIVPRKVGIVRHLAEKKRI